MAKKKKKTRRSSERAVARRKAKRKAARRSAGGGGSRSSELRRASRWPILSTLISPGWQEDLLATYVIVRGNDAGALAMASFLVDLGCRGVVGANLHLGLDHWDVEELLDRLAGDRGLEPCAPSLGPAILRAALAYATPLGFLPDPDLRHAAVLLGDLDADHCSEAIPCGRDGKPLYVAGPYDDVPRTLARLERMLGPGGFDFIAPAQGGAPTSAPALEPALEPDALMQRCANLKRRLVAYGRSRPLRAELRAFVRDRLDDGATADTLYDDELDRFLLTHRMRDGRSILQAFVDGERGLSADDRRLVLSWSDPVEGCFEILRADHDRALLFNHIDRLEYLARSNNGPALHATLTEGSFLLGRVVPLDEGSWLLSSELRLLPADSRAHLLKLSAQMASRHPRALFRNPELLERGWQEEARMRRVFIERFGGDELFVAGSDLRATLDGFMQACQDDVTPADAAQDRAPAPPMSLPAHLLQAEEVALVYDDVWGLGMYPDYRVFRETFEAPLLAADPQHAQAVRGFLESPDIDPAPFRSVARRWPQAVDTVLRQVLGRPELRFERDCEALMREFKPDLMRLPPIPRIVPLPPELVEALDG